MRFEFFRKNLLNEERFPPKSNHPASSDNFIFKLKHEKNKIISISQELFLKIKCKAGSGII